MVIQIVLGTSNHLSDNGFSIEEQGDLYDETLEDVIRFPRWYLDNLDYLVTYRVSWHNYRSRKSVMPRAYVRKV